MSANVMTKRLLMKKIQHFRKTSLCIRIQAFKDMNQRMFRRFNPRKKPQGKELTLEQREQNSLISRVRIVIEHILAGMKRCRIVKDVFRNTKKKYDDLAIPS